MERNITLTEDGYDELVETLAEAVIAENKSEVEEAVLNDTVDELQEKIPGRIVRLVEHNSKHGEAVTLGFDMANKAYLSSIVEHSESSGFSGYREWTEEHYDRTTPLTPQEALSSAALFCLQRDVSKLTRPRFREIIEKTEENLAVPGGDN